ncbi:MAG: serine/threonine-protein kinase, partial [Planctomycetaceae bacterium]
MMDDKTLAIAALRLPPEQRTQFLNQVCAGEPALRTAVDTMLAAESSLAANQDAPTHRTCKLTEPDCTLHSPPKEGTESTSPGLPSATEETVPYFGDYELLGVLGRGGMGVVYKARQLSLKRFVALKMMQAGAFASERDRRRFRNEVEAIAFLDHPGIVPVYEVGEYNGAPFFSMKLIEGGTLASRLSQFPSDPRATATLVAQIAQAVQHAHERGVLHRDLKPANILLDDTGGVHVADFGLAKRGSSDHQLTTTGELLGSPAYMSPEQATGTAQGISPATDVYGVG